MKTIGNINVLFVLALILTACTAVSAGSATTPLPPSTQTSPPNLLPNTGMPKLPEPIGTPLTEWNGIPVMPGAIAGDVVNEGYSFLVQAVPDEIQKYYESEMTKLGWEAFAGAPSANGTILLMFAKESDAVSVFITSQPNGPTHVLLVK